MIMLRTIFISAIALSSCTWVDLQEGADQVSVILGQLPDSCVKTSEVRVSVVDKVLLQRSAVKVVEELQTLARNEAIGKGDAIKATSAVMDGEQSYNIYRCSQ